MWRAGGCRTGFASIRQERSAGRAVPGPDGSAAQRQGRPRNAGEIFHAKRPLSLTFHCLFMVVSPMQARERFGIAAVRVDCVEGNNGVAIARNASLVMHVPSIPADGCRGSGTSPVCSGSRKARKRVPTRVMSAASIARPVASESVNTGLEAAARRWPTPVTLSGRGVGNSARRRCRGSDSPAEHSGAGEELPPRRR